MSERGGISHRRHQQHRPREARPAHVDHTLMPALTKIAPALDDAPSFTLDVANLYIANCDRPGSPSCFFFWHKDKNEACALPSAEHAHHVWHDDETTTRARPSAEQAQRVGHAWQASLVGRVLGGSPNAPASRACVVSGAACGIMSAAAVRPEARTRAALVARSHPAPPRLSPLVQFRAYTMSVAHDAKTRDLELGLPMWVHPRVPKLR